MYIYIYIYTVSIKLQIYASTIGFLLTLDHVYVNTGYVK